MAQVFRAADLELTRNTSPIADFAWDASRPLKELVGGKYLHFDVKSLLPDRFSYPYHFHRNAEELFVALQGEATLRSPEGCQVVGQGDVLFFGEGPQGAHQLYNHTDQPFVYLDLCTAANVDVCEYPDSGKINILPTIEVFQREARVPYYTGEDGVREKWPAEIVGKPEA